jgi:hypothetical protein
MMAAQPVTGEVLLAGGPVESLDAYLARGDGEGAGGRCVPWR